MRRYRVWKSRGTGSVMRHLRRIKRTNLISISWISWKWHIVMFLRSEFTSKHFWMKSERNMHRLQERIFSTSLDCITSLNLRRMEKISHRWCKWHDWMITRMIRSSIWIPCLQFSRALRVGRGWIRRCWLVRAPRQFKSIEQFRIRWGSFLHHTLLWGLLSNKLNEIETRILDNVRRPWISPKVTRMIFRQRIWISPPLSLIN